MPLIKHTTRHRQEGALDALDAAQDGAFFEAQLLRAISLAVSAAGFDSMTPSAMEAFRAQIESYMLHFLSIVRSHMQSCRRTQPIPQDFIFALTKHNIMSSDLEAQLALRPKLPQVTMPPIAPAERDNWQQTAQPDILFGDQSTDQAKKTYIPAHLPKLPPTHTYKQTSIFTKREEDARAIREKATAEGVLAEQAMRKLLIGSGEGRPKIVFPAAAQEKAWQETMDEFTRIDAEQAAREDEDDFGNLGGRQEDYDSALLVNYEKRFWRKAARGV